MAIIAYDCPNCGAKLSPDDSQSRASCDYCGANFALRRPEKPAPPPASAYSPAAAAATAGTPARTPAVALGVSIVVITMAAGIGVTVISRTSTGRDWATAAATATATAMANAPGLVGQADFSWDSNGGPLQTIELDGQDHVVGRVRVRDGDALHIAVFSAETGALRYRVGPFGSYSDGYRNTHFAIADGRLIVTDYRSSLRLFNLGDGSPVQAISLTDRVDQVCQVDADDGDGSQLFVRQVDKREFRLDAATATLTDAKLPKACADLQWRNARKGDPRVTQKSALAKAPKIDGMAVKAVHIAGTVAVARGEKSPGTAQPLAAGFDPNTKAVRWQGPVAAVDPASVRERDNDLDALVAGRYIATYGEGPKLWHVTAFDGETGARLWDQTLRKIFAVDWLFGVAATQRHVFVVRMSSVEVYDATTGALKTTIGSESYER